MRFSTRAAFAAAGIEVALVVSGCGSSSGSNSGGGSKNN
jgi:hypothetical protein